MPFSQVAITAVSPPQYRRGQAYLSWTSTSPAGTWWQVYVNGQLAWFKQQTWAWVPIPGGPVRIDVGAVAPGEEQLAWPTYLPAAPERRVTLSWQSGYYQAADLAGFRVYSSLAPGGSVSYAAPVATLAAYPGGIDTSGFGSGAFGSGGFGSVASSYAWTSSPLDAGEWSFAVVPFDAAGNAGAAQTTMIAVACPPRLPAAFAGTQRRLQYSYTPTNTVLSWNAPLV
jgi:hypothetical protein